MRHLLVILLLAPLPVLAQGPSRVSLDDVVVPRKTEIFIRLHRAINSRTARPGDKFPASILVPVTVDDKIAIPVGSHIIGHVASQSGAGYFRGKGELLLAFDTVILPDGTTRRLVAIVESADNYSADPTKEDGQLRAPGNQGEEVLVEAGKGAAAGVVTGAVVGVFHGSAGRSMGVGALAGAAGGAVVGLLKKGEDVELPNGSSLTIQIQDSIRFERNEPAPAGQPLEAKPPQDP